MGGGPEIGNFSNFEEYEAEKRKSDVIKILDSCAVKEELLTEIIKQLFHGMFSLADEELNEVFKKSFETAVNKWKDRLAGIYVKAVCESAKSSEAFIETCAYFKSVFTQLPSTFGTFEKTRFAILRLLVERWGRISLETTKESVEIFRFISDVYGGYGRYDLLQNLIAELLRKVISSPDFSAEVCEKWLTVPDVPEEIRKVFRIAWIRNGGQELFDRCMKNAEILKPLEPEKRSSAATELIKDLCRQVEMVDKGVQKFQLLEGLAKYFPTTAEIGVFYQGIFKIELTVSLDENDYLQWQHNPLHCHKDYLVKWREKLYPSGSINVRVQSKI